MDKFTAFRDFMSQEGPDYCEHGADSSCVECEVIGLRKQVAEFDNEIEEAIAEAHAEEREKLEADAMRYRWLCDGHGYFLEEQQLCGHGNEKEFADAAIDTAMGKARYEVHDQTATD